jgi:hypothetical protein
MKNLNLIQDYYSSYWFYPNHYNFMRKDYIPQGIYFAKISNVRFTKTKEGKPAVDVCFTVIDAISQYRYLNGIIAADEEYDCYYIMDRITCNSKKHKIFEEYARKSFGYYTSKNLKNLIGYTELLGISHSTDTEYGYIRRRRPFSPAELKSLAI